MTLSDLGLTESVNLRKQAYWAARQGYPETACVFRRLAGILERAEEVRSDTLNGVVSYILNGGGHVEEAKKDRVMYDFASLLDAVDARTALGAVAFTETAGRFTMTLDRAPLPFDRVLACRRSAYRRAEQYLKEGLTCFTVMDGPWTLKLKEA